VSGCSDKTQIDPVRVTTVTDEDAVGGRPCPMCEEPLYKRHCKYVCPQHGVIMDCSDTFWN